MKRTLALYGLASALSLACLAVPATAQDAVKIGVLSDMNGPFSRLAGPGSVYAAQLAVEDMGGQVLGKKIEIVQADHQNKPGYRRGAPRGDGSTPRA